MDESLNPAQIKQMITMLQGMLPENASEVNTQHTPTQEETKNTQAPPTQPKRVNRFDSMPEKTMHQSDTLIDKKLNVSD